jgi:hypothetical protein
MLSNVLVTESDLLQISSDMMSETPLEIADTTNEATLGIAVIDSVEKSTSGITADTFEEVNNSTDTENDVKDSAHNIGDPHIAYLETIHKRIFPILSRYLGDASTGMSFYHY